MRRKLVLVGLLFGAFLGYGGMFARMWAYHHFRGAERAHGFRGRAALEQRVADVCVDAALRARARDLPARGAGD